VLLTFSYQMATFYLVIQKLTKRLRLCSDT